MPIWTAVAVVVAAFLLRSLVIRGGDFALDRADWLVLACVVIGIALVALARRSDSANEKPDEADAERCDEDDEAGGEG